MRLYWVQVDLRHEPLSTIHFDAPVEVTRFIIFLLCVLSINIVFIAASIVYLHYFGANCSSVLYQFRELLYLLVLSF